MAATSRVPNSSAETPLQRQLAHAGERPTPLDAFHLAKRTILAGQRLDMRALAAELGINRVTLYRWVGARDQLLVEVLWSLTEGTISNVWRELSATPGPRVPEALRRWIRLTIDNPGVRDFLHGESELAIRLLTLRPGGYQPRLLALVHDLIRTDLEEGRATTTLSLDELAFTVVRICESGIYLPVITGAPADPDMVARVVSVLLPPPAPIGPPARTASRPRSGRVAR